MKKANVLYVITKLELGGAQKQLLSLIRSLDHTKNKALLFTAKEGLLIDEALSIDGLAIKRSAFLERPVNPPKDLLALIELYRFIKKNNIDIVHTHSSKAGILGRLAARLAGVKVILHTVHGWSFNDYQPSLKRIFFIYLERFAAKFTDKLIVVSRYDKHKGLSNRIGSEGKYAFIRYGIDYKQFAASDLNIREELGMKPDDLAVGTLSCFKPQKSPQDFVKLAFLINKSAPGIKFIMTGDGILRKDLKKLISKFNLQDKVILTGWRSDSSRVLSSMDVFVLTSLWEGLPISALEAMAASKPIVVTDTGGISERIAEGQNGFLVRPRDMEKMSEKLLVLLSDKNLRKRIGQNARESLGADFTVENMVKDNVNLYENLLGGKEGGIC